MNRATTAFLILLTLPCATSAARAWGPEGHAIVADIAQAHLSKQASAEVSRLLAPEGYARLDDVSSWADAYRIDYPDTGPWHFVDIPLRSHKYDEQRDCHFNKDGQRVKELTCIVAKLPELVDVLSNHSKSDDARRMALKFVVHFVGDLHQPLHVADNHDKGGNCFTLSYAYYNGSNNLHQVWDSGIIERHFAWTLGWNYSFDHIRVAAAATKLDTAISSAERGLWAPPDLVINMQTRVIEWTNETHKLAPAAYSHIPPDETGKWTDTYQGYAWPVVQVQLQLAGVRLAEILNEALK